MRSSKMLRQTINTATGQILAGPGAARYQPPPEPNKDKEPKGGGPSCFLVSVPWLEHDESYDDSLELRTCCVTWATVMEPLPYPALPPYEKPQPKRLKKKKFKHKIKKGW
jgi:hypothetical protein